MLNKKGQVGFGLAKSVIAIIFAIAILAIVTVTLLNSMLALDPVDTFNGATITNETINITGGPSSISNTPTTVGIGRSNVVYSNLVVVNATNTSQVVPTSNWTNTANGSFVPTFGGYTNRTVQVSGSWTFDGDSGSVGVVRNSTTGITAFFNTIPAAMIILGLVILILIIVIVVRVVNGNDFAGNNRGAL